MEHISHYIHMMSLHAHNDALMCKVFPFSLGSMVLRWFNGLRKGSIRSFAKLIQEFGSRFVTCSRVPHPVDALLSIKMRVRETLQSYASRYWELYNEIGEGNEKIMASIFRMGLPEDSELRESLTKRPPKDMRQLMRRIEEYKRLEDDRLQNRGKAPLFGRSWQGVVPARPKKDFRMQEPKAQAEGVNVAFKEPVHKILDQIKNESFFRWPNKMGGDPSRRNQNLYCTYHRDKGHTTEQCRVLKDHLGQLVKARYLKEFVVDSTSRESGQDVQQKRNPFPPPLGVIEVIHATLRGTTAAKRISAMACRERETPEKKKKVERQTISFGEEDLEGTIQPHDDALVVTARISGFLVKRVMIDQGSGADVMYSDLFKGLELKSQDLAKYDTPLVSFDWRIVVPEGQISLSMGMEGKELIVTFIVVRSFSPYTAILGRPWIHTMKAIPSTLHVKVKFPTEYGVAEVKGNQRVARQCLVAAVRWKNEQLGSEEQTDRETL